LGVTQGVTGLGSSWSSSASLGGWRVSGRAATAIASPGANRVTPIRPRLRRERARLADTPVLQCALPRPSWNLWSQSRWSHSRPRERLCRYGHCKHWQCLVIYLRKRQEQRLDPQQDFSWLRTNSILLKRSSTASPVGRRTATKFGWRRRDGCWHRQRCLRVRPIRFSKDNQQSNS
jgi:hypothetical protein